MNTTTVIPPERVREAILRILATPPQPCWLCGDQLHRIAVPELDEFGWADENGGRMGLDSDLRPLPDGDPYARLQELDQTIMATHALPAVKRGKAELTPLFWARAREYSALKARMDFGGMYHTHQVRDSNRTAWDGPPCPEHCGWPMRLAPSGWRCRQCPNGFFPSRECSSPDGPAK